MKPNIVNTFSKWQKSLMAEAVDDHFSEISRHIEYLGLDCTPYDLLEGTQLLMAAVVSYRQMDGRDSRKLISKQRYRLGGEGLPYYCLTFDLISGHYGRILVDQEFKDVDFADLFDQPWYEYESVGYYRVWVSRLDGKKIRRKEVNSILASVKNDLYFDFSEDELSVGIEMTELDDTVIVNVDDFIK